MEKKIVTIMALSIALSYTNFVVAQSFFSRTIKGEKSEYNVKDSTVANLYTLSNINNTWGTDNYPKNTVEYGGGLYSNEDYINVYKIIKSTLDPMVFQKLMNSVRVQNAYTKPNIYTIEKLKKVANELSVFVVFSPHTGKVYEVFFFMRGDIFKNMSPDYFFEIEKEIKEKITLNIKWKDYLQCRFLYLFNDLDNTTIKGERIIPSEIQ